MILELNCQFIFIGWFAASMPKSRQKLSHFNAKCRIQYIFGRFFFMTFWKRIHLDKDFCNFEGNLSSKQPEFPLLCFFCSIQSSIPLLCKLAHYNFKKKSKMKMWGNPRAIECKVSIRERKKGYAFFW